MPSLFELPNELLDIIKLEAIRYDYPLRHLFDTDILVHACPTNGLLATNRALYEELAPQFYATNTFVLSIGVLEAISEGELPTFVPLERLQHVRLIALFCQDGNGQRPVSQLPRRIVENSPWTDQRLMTSLCGTIRTHRPPFETFTHRLAAPMIMGTRLSPRPADGSGETPRLIDYQSVVWQSMDLFAAKDQTLGLGFRLDHLCRALVLELWLDDRHCPAARAALPRDRQRLRNLGPALPAGLPMEPFTLLPAVKHRLSWQVPSWASMRCSKAEVRTAKERGVLVRMELFFERWHGEFRVN